MGSLAPGAKTQQLHDTEQPQLGHRLGEQPAGAGGCMSVPHYPTMPVLAARAAAGLSLAASFLA